MEVPKRRVLRVVYFYLKSNLPSLINDSDEGSDSVPGDGEMKKREGERASRFIWTRAGGERERASALVREGWGGWWWGFLCALFRAEVLTEGPWPPLSRNSLTLSLRAQRAHMLRHCMAGAFGKGRGGETEPSKQPTNTTQHRAVPGVIESMFLCLTSHFRDPKGGPKAAWGKSLRPSV